MVHAVANSTVPKFTVIIGGSFGAGNYGMCGRAYSAALPLDVAERADLGDGRRTGRRRADDRRSATSSRAQGRKLSAEEERSIADPVLEKYETEGSPYYSTARLWDDGVIDPADTRSVRAGVVGGL